MRWIRSGVRRRPSRSGSSPISVRMSRTACSTRPFVVSGGGAWSVSHGASPSSPISDAISWTSFGTCSGRSSVGGVLGGRRSLIVDGWYVPLHDTDCRRGRHHRDMAGDAPRSGRVIVLNGTSSSGKSTLSRALQARLDGPWLGIGIDTVVFALPSGDLNPPRWAEVFRYVPPEPGSDAPFRIETGELGHRLV